MHQNIDFILIAVSKCLVFSGRIRNKTLSLCVGGLGQLGVGLAQILR